MYCSLRSASIAEGCLVAVAFAIFSNCQADEPPPPADKPNIVFIMVDDLGIGELQWYPGEADISARTADTTDVIQTPVLFQLAKQGLRFSNYHSPAPVCSPARAAILTSRYPQEFNIRDYFPDSTSRSLPAGIPTIASLLHDQAGYRTGHFGKWHLGKSRPEHLPVHFGFDEALTRDGYDLLAGYMGTTFIEGDDIANEAVIAPSEHSAATITSRAIQFIESAEADNQPYFLNLWYRAPHNPLDPPANFPKAVTGSFQPKTWSNWPLTWSEFVQTIPALQGLAYLEDHSTTADAKQRAMYIATVAWLDYQIGRLVARIDELGPGGNTLIILVSDNGAAQKIYATGNGVVPGTWQPNGALSGFKQSTLEGGLRVPLIVRWPAASLSSGQVIDDLITGYDLLPTILGAAGVSVAAENFVGVSMLPRILVEDPAPVHAQPVFWENRYLGSFWGGKDPFTSLNDEQNNYAIWDESVNRKFVTSRSASNGVLYDGLFDVNTLNSSGVDESVSVNLEQQESAVAATLEQEYRSWRNQVGLIPHAYDLAQSTADIDQACLDFAAANKKVQLQDDERFRFREGDFSFQARIELDTVPVAPGAVIAEHPGSWSLTVGPGSNANQASTSLTIFGKDSAPNVYPGTPGDAVSISGQVVCGDPCGFNVAFSVLGLADGESSVRLYLNGTPVGEYRGNGKDALVFKEVYADNYSTIRIGNDASGQHGIVGQVIDPRIFGMNLTPVEIAANMAEQAAEVCSSGGCH